VPNKPLYFALWGIVRKLAILYNFYKKARHFTVSGFFLL